MLGVLLLQVLPQLFEHLHTVEQVEQEAVIGVDLFLAAVVTVAVQANI